MRKIVFEETEKSIKLDEISSLEKNDFEDKYFGIQYGKYVEGLILKFLGNWSFLRLSELHTGRSIEFINLSLEPTLKNTIENLMKSGFDVVYLESLEELKEWIFSTKSV